MKQLVIAEYGTFLGVRAGLLVARGADRTERTWPMNRLSSVCIAKRGVSISSDLVEMLSVRGVKLFFLGFKGTAHASLIGNVQHGVVQARFNQYKFCQGSLSGGEREAGAATTSGEQSAGDPLALAKRIVEAKVKNQRAVLNYFAKYHKSEGLSSSSESLKTNLIQIPAAKTHEELLGFEGASARAYFAALKEAGLLPPSFKGRKGRGSSEITNSMLNFGYAILSSYILAAVENAGLEPHLGVLHSIRPGKMSLVLDIMEEYRAWVVDRVVIKLRGQAEKAGQMTPELKKALIAGIQATCGKRYLYRRKQVKLEHIMQRQVYRLSGHFSTGRKYRPYLFRW